MKDFYYSKKHDMHMKRMCQLRGDKYVTTYIEGNQYTEMTDEGVTPSVNSFDDIVKVCTSDSEITIE